MSAWIARDEAVSLGFGERSRQDGDPGPHNHGWKDTVSLNNGDYAELVVRFDGYKGMYVFHCHNLEHEDMMMMGNIQVS